MGVVAIMLNGHHILSTRARLQLLYLLKTHVL